MPDAAEDIARRWGILHGIPSPGASAQPLLSPRSVTDSFDSVLREARLGVKHRVELQNGEFRSIK
eukprot:497866-Prymnesium_polylepis.1